MAYKRELISETKNLFDSNNIDTQWLGIRYKSISNGKILLNGAKEPGLNIFPVTRPNITLPAGTYTLSCRMLAGNIEGYDITFNRWIYFGINGSSGAYRCDGVGKVGDYATKTFTLTEDTLLSSFDITAGYTNDFNIDNVMIECQLEKGSTATNYVPYGYLTSYKKLLKVSDVCQLLDKSKYPATRTINGVTFTNNGDGTITANGTATKETNLLLNNNEVPIIKNHIYCVLGSPFGGSSRTYYTSTSWGSEDGNGIIQKNTRDIISGNYYIHIEPNYTANNLVFIPQVFDLTEMYGAGNEPKTVAEFKAKFPNEMYDYSPRCWVTSYKTGLIAKTKNLFNWSGKLRYAYDTAQCTIVETLTNGAILQGNIGSVPGNASYYNGWFRPGSIDGYVTAVTLSANDVVTISADYEILERNYASPTTIGVYLYGTEEMAHPYASPIETGVLYRIKDTYTVTKDGQYYPVFTLNSSKVKITNIQIEKGSEATEYTPYGYL